MSRFFASQNSNLVPYVPGEQIQNGKYIKLNTNELPYSPSPRVEREFKDIDIDRLRLYSDPECKTLCKTVSNFYGLEPNQVVVGNGSDEILAFIYMAFFSRGDSLCFPNITYGFYKVYAELFGINPIVVPLWNDFTLSLRDYYHKDGHVIIANPNAPTGMAVSVEEIEDFLQNNPKRLLIVDEAYADFWTDSCVRLVNRYDNLLVVQTLSKSRALAGMRVGVAVGNRELIRDLNRIRFSFNPYNVNMVSQRLATAAFEDVGYLRETSEKVVATRERCTAVLRSLGCIVTDSCANFIFVKSHKIGGEELYLSLKKNGILVRHFPDPLLCDYIRVSIGTDDEMDVFLNNMKQFLQ